jgi:hypothetical protein
MTSVGAIFQIFLGFYISPYQEQASEGISEG